MQRLVRVSQELGVEVWAKLEDRCGIWGGNKVRKLEYILGRARADGIERLVGYGAGTSNWTSALAFHGAAQGFEVSLRVTEPGVPAAYDRLYRDLGTNVTHVGRAAWFLSARGHRLLPADRATRHLPLGGSGPEGDLGSLHAGIELADAVRDGELPAPGLVFVAAGTAGTAAGLSVGATVGGLAAKVVCVRVVAWPYGTARHVDLRARSLARRAGVARSGHRLRADASQLGPGYARPSAASLAAASLAARDGLWLDQAYGAKAFASLIAHARRGVPGPYLFLHPSPGDPPPAGSIGS